MDQKKLFIFPSATHLNIEIGVKCRKWAVSDIDEVTMRGRFTKSQKMEIGSRGLLYSHENGQFTVPFITRSKAKYEVVRDVWPEPWALPFEIEPLGPSSRGENLRAAKEFWPMFKGVSNVTQVAPLGGRYAFVARPISEDDWNQIIRMLGYKEGEVC
jgi:hypothetical protein